MPTNYVTYKEIYKIRKCIVPVWLGLSPGKVNARIIGKENPMKKDEFPIISGGLKDSAVNNHGRGWPMNVELMVRRNVQ